MGRRYEYGTTLGTLGSTAAQTVMVAVFPVLLGPFAPSAIWIGFAIGGEGLFALLVPYWIGAASDALPQRWAERFGRRGIFLGITAPLMAAGLAVSPFLEGYWPLALAAFVFFAAFHGYLTPLWALMVDTVPPERRGRVHGVRGALHAAGLAFGLVGGGLLYALWPPLPFLLAAVLVLVSTALTLAAARGAASRNVDRLPRPLSAGERGRAWRDLLSHPAIRWFLVANALWTAATDGIRPYIFLFAEAVLGIDTAMTSLALALLVGGVGVGSVIIGRIGDTVGRGRLLMAGVLMTTIITAMGLLMRSFGTAVILLSLAGVAASALIALPYPIFTSLVGDEDIGRYTGLYILSLGLARIAAPVVVGAAIDIGAAVFPESDGYPMMWPVAAAFAALSALALQRALHARRTVAPERTSP